MKRIFQALAVLALLGLGVFWAMSAEFPLEASAIPQHAADLKNGERMYHLGGCISCHASPAAADVPSGGKPLKTPIGTLYPPNLTPDSETGLGRWSDLEFINAMQRGLKRGGGHLIPAFPYTSYAHMAVGDVLDIKAYLATLPPVKNATPPHEVMALPLVRRGIGAWKWLGLYQNPFGRPESNNKIMAGEYLVNGAGHCQECHTPRTLFMATDTSKPFVGGPHPEGKGQVPSLRNLVGRGRFKDAADLVLAFQQGEIMGYDHMSSGGMGDVQTNLSHLPEADLKAIADYLVTLAP